MISPSRVKHQQQKQPSRNNSDTHSHVRLQKGRKPLEKKSFYLDVKNHALSTFIEGKIKDLGGTIEVFLVKSVTIVVSDRADTLGQNNCDKKKWGYASGESGGTPSLKSIEVRTPISTPPTPYGAEYPLSNSTNIRGQTAQRTKSRADAMLERALTQPQQCSVDPLNNALNWGIRIWSTKKVQGWLEKIYESLKDNGTLKRNGDLSNTEKNLKVKQLKNSYIKFESFKRESRPVFLELPVWPKLNFDGDPGTCPFDLRTQEKKVYKEESDTLKKQKSKEMTRRPRATATRTRRTDALVAGYCEICRIDYRDLSKHLQSDKHLAFVRNDDNFLSLDKLIDSGASVEAFLRANEVGQDCNLFPDGDQSLNSVDIDDVKVNKSAEKTNVSSFAVDEIKMVQCNGARRNLNLKLSPQHNLRTRSRHESGHSLRSKGGPWHDKSDKFYDRFEGFTIKKRAKGTIWIDEDEIPMVKKCSRIDVMKEIDNSGDDLDGENAMVTGSYDEDDDRGDFACKSKESVGSGRRENCAKRGGDSFGDRVLPKLERNDAVGSDIENESTRISNIPRLEREIRANDEAPSRRANAERKFSAPPQRPSIDEIDDSSKDGFNGFERIQALESFPASQLPGNTTKTNCPGDKSPRREAPPNVEKNEGNCELEITCNGGSVAEDKCEKIGKEPADERPKVGKIGSKRGARSYRGRPRLSVEERLIEDNRAYYKVEVLGNKLRSSTGPWSTSVSANNGTVIVNNNNVNNSGATRLQDPDGGSSGGNPEADGKPGEKEVSSEKPVVVRFKRVRRSELSLLSDEAESFMFGDPRRDDCTSSEVSDADQSSVLPRETESDWDANSVNGQSPLPSSTINSSCSPIKQEIEEDSAADDSLLGRARKRRRTQAEVFIKDNEDYYKFETPGSRLRFQGALTSASKDTESQGIGDSQPAESELGVEKLYPSKPSPEVEKMQFSFEAVPRSEPWYQTYQRQDEGAEYWHYFSESDYRKPFLLPYEIENFQEQLAKMCQRTEGRRRGTRGRGRNGLGRSPRKSPRCHASTLAIMSTIIRKREQQQPSTTTTALGSILEEESPSRCSSRSQNDTPRPESKLPPSQDIPKSDTDTELREMAKNIDDMLSADVAYADLDDSFETGMMLENAEETGNVATIHTDRGAPPDLLDLLDNCHEYYNCIENSSCASSECGENGAESPHKRRKRRKNRTGWPGIKMRKKMHAKQMEEYNENFNRMKKTTEKKSLCDESCADSLLDRLQVSTTRETCSDEVSVAPTDDRDAKMEDVAKHSETAGESTDTPPLQCETISGSEDSAALPIKNPESSECKDSAADLMSNEISCSLTNDENDVSRTDPNSSVIATRQNVGKIATRKRQRNRESPASVIDSRHEIENNDIIYKNVNSTIISRKNYTQNGITKRRTPRENSTSTGPSRAENECVNADHLHLHNHNLNHHSSHHPYDVNACQKESVRQRQSVRTRKRRRRPTGSGGGDDAIPVEEHYVKDENCKKDDYTEMRSPNKTENLRLVKRRNNTVVETDVPERSSEAETDCDVGSGAGGGAGGGGAATTGGGRLGELVSPSLLPTTVGSFKNRRSSIEFQPVVRMMKIEDQPDIDHSSILSVTVASNRRLRSSSSPRSNVQPTAKRYKRSKGPFGRWIKNS